MEIQKQKTFIDYFEQNQIRDMFINLDLSSSYGELSVYADSNLALRLAGISGGGGLGNLKATFTLS